jgi:uncharacterized protein (DUF427 family)
MTPAPGWGELMTNAARVTTRDADRSGFDLRPDYRVDILCRRNTVSVELGGRLIAETTHALLVDEQDHGLVFYVPSADVRVRLRLDSDRTSRCPYKGIASYWRFEDDGGTAVCWSYEDPVDQVARLRGHVAFRQGRVDVRVGVAAPSAPGRCR